MQPRLQSKKHGKKVRRTARTDFLIKLSLALGVSLNEIREWSEKDLALYYDFVCQHGLPNDRLEHLLAQIPYIQCLLKGDKKVKPDTFMLKTDRKIVQTNTTPSQKQRRGFAGLTGAVPRKRRKF